MSLFVFCYSSGWKMFSDQINWSQVPSTPALSLCCQSSLFIIGKQAATIIALMVQPEQITSGHKERPWRWQPERKGANELKHFAFLWGMWPRFFFKEKKYKERRKECGGGVCLFPPRINGSKSNNAHPASIMPNWRALSGKTQKHWHS